MSIRITHQPLTQQMIDEVFEKAQCQQSYMVGLYLIALPDFDQIERVERWPSVSNNTWIYICEKAADFDKVHHPRVLPGGMWLNHGFSSANIPDWTVSTNTCNVVYKTTPSQNGVQTP